MGSCFRTADAAGVSRIILSGYTPTPLDRFNQPRADLHKVALGAEKSVPWEHVKTVGPTLAKLKKENYFVVAIEQDQHSTPLFDFVQPKSTDGIPVELALLLGNEVRGISKPLLQKCDAILEIPMKGKKESLNVSVTAGVALFFLTNKKERL